MNMRKKVNWEQMPKSKEISAHIAYYYSDQKSELPVRGVRKYRDNKADPNIETRTYGLFSTCMPPARRNMVKNKNQYIFFFTKRGIKRMFTGYYELDGFLNTGIKPRNKRKEYKFKDYALRAKKTHFIKDGILLTGKLWSEISVNNVKSNSIAGYGPRDYKSIGSSLALELKKALDKHKDITDAYVKEIHKLEQENLKNSNNEFRYPSWTRKEGFTKNDIRRFIK